MMSSKNPIVRALIALCFCGAAASAQAQQFQQWISDASGSTKVGTQVKVERFTPATGRQIKAAGFDFVRFGVWINSMQAEDYRKRVGDAFAAAQQSGLPVLLTVRSTVPLARSATGQTVRDAQLQMAARQLADMIRDLDSAYGRNLLAIELWNEPDLPTYWPTGDVETTFPVYMRMLCTELKRIHTPSPIIGFGFAKVPLPGSKSDRLLRRVAESSAHCIDAVSYHAYGMSELQIENASTYIRDQYGLPALITEWGASSGGWAGASGQAENIESFLSKRRSMKTPLVSIYEWQDTRNGKNTRERNLGLVDAAGEEKPALGAALTVLRKR
ncbi:glycoside hydrolase family 5 protein [Paraburkholderia rhynchosiae]|uniref:Uncharacterized protein n=1 Tax=Paraburkholderia rhynchosiae TaxID=487049 RepID=A0A2N7WNG2_9BURK|nr:cellulase family glycosylhydrolase [Paraburkholderia rhynchosiae]PMS30949.1 hypothetical protein C0Z16_11975 [Paraburkholderia rhynchosiae]CAB3732799.1 hypothetical protein LMG27174_05963 [Paraburkholderia rhynchosiae]